MLDPGTREVSYQSGVLFAASDSLLSVTNESTIALALSDFSLPSCVSED